MDQLDTMLHNIGKDKIKASDHLVLRAQVNAHETRRLNVWLIGLLLMSFISLSALGILTMSYIPLGWGWKTMFGFCTWLLILSMQVVMLIKRDQIRALCSFLVS